jgi:hypothetical protein
MYGVFFVKLNNPTSSLSHLIISIAFHNNYHRSITYFLILITTSYDLEKKNTAAIIIFLIRNTINSIHSTISQKIKINACAHHA